MKPQDFISIYMPFAKQSEAKTGISALASMGQAALESSWGDKAVGNCLFGVKANPKTVPNNKRQLITTTEYLKSPNVQFPEVISVTKQANGLYKYKVKDWFRKYDTPEEAFTDHGNFFLTNPRYKKALEVKNDPYAFADAIAAAGYATAVGYGDTLKSVIRSIEKRLI